MQISPMKRIRTIALVLVMACLSTLASSCSSVSRWMNPGGTYFVIEVDPGPENKDAAIEHVVSVLSSGLYAIGVPGEVTRGHLKIGGKDSVVVDVWGEQDLQALRKFLLETSKLELLPVISEKHPALPCTAKAEEAREKAGEGQMVLSQFDYTGERHCVLGTTPILTGKHVRTADAVANQDGNGYSINFSLNAEGGELMSKWSKANIGNYIASVYNGKILSIAYVQEEISDTGVINATMEKGEAEEIARGIGSRYLPYKLTLVEERTYEE
ncbi:MAG: hypothetical protein J5I65_15315 [Aridibacter famidurans]|nr:hypothetical protein [Aridibacter famidurans]